MGHQYNIPRVRCADLDLVGVINPLGDIFLVLK